MTDAELDLLERRARDFLELTQAVDHKPEYLDRRGGSIVHGGKPAPQGKAHPNLLRGRDRHFGAKLADPGQAFNDAVEVAVADRLRQETGI